MSPVMMFGIAFGIIIVILVVRTKKAGPPQLSEMELSRAVVVKRATVADPGEGWTRLGRKTKAEGLNLWFDADDDPDAEAAFMVEDRAVQTSLAHRKTVRLTADFETHHIHTNGCVFRVSVRGTGEVVGKDIMMKMKTYGDQEPAFGGVENEDSTDPAMGGWIEFEWVEVLTVDRRG